MLLEIRNFWENSTNSKEIVKRKSFRTKMRQAKEKLKKLSVIFWIWHRMNCLALLTERLKIR